MNQYALEYAIANALEAVGEARSDDTLKAASNIMRERIGERVKLEMEARMQLMEERRRIEEELRK